MTRQGGPDPLLHEIPSTTLRDDASMWSGCYNDTNARENVFLGLAEGGLGEKDDEEEEEEEGYIANPCSRRSNLTDRNGIRADSGWGIAA